MQASRLRLIADSAILDGRKSGNLRIPAWRVCCSPCGMLLDDQALNKLTGGILAAAIEVHRVLGPGLLESIYLTCLQFELSDRGLRYTVQQPLPVKYKTHVLPSVYRIDLIVEDCVVVEVKAVDALAPVFSAQVLTYLRIADKPAGLLINFNVPRLMDGVKRLLRPRGEREPQTCDGPAQRGTMRNGE